jgi:hypothetical protein
MSKLSKSPPNILIWIIYLFIYFYEKRFESKIWKNRDNNIKFKVFNYLFLWKLCLSARFLFKKKHDRDNNIK